jgi:hypothetical protein
LLEQARLAARNELDLNKMQLEAELDAAKLAMGQSGPGLTKVVDPYGR